MTVNRLGSDPLSGISKGLWLTCTRAVIILWRIQVCCLALREQGLMMTSAPTENSKPTTAEIAASSAHMMQFITGSFVSQVVRAFAELGIADLLDERPATAPEIAAATGAHAEATARLLRAGTALGLVTADNKTGFSATPLLQTLRQNAPGSLRGLAIALASPGTWLPWGNLVATVRTGQRQTVAVHGMDYFEYLVQHPAEAQIFTAAMDGITGSLAEQVVKIIETQSVSMAADIGGASGTLLYTLLLANPQLHGVVYDRPNVVPSAVAKAKRLGLTERVSVVAGDFFDAVPQADLYLLKWILHDWDDVSCIRDSRELSSCHATRWPCRCA